MRAGFLLLLAMAADCGTDPDDAPFPADYRATYTEVRDCRKSGDHDLNNIRVLADPAALEAYRDRNAPFPVGSIVLKEEFDFADVDCTGPVIQWTVMERLAEGSSPATLDWRWYEVNAERTITGTDVPACIGCHTGCGVPPDGYQGTCAVP